MKPKLPLGPLRYDGPITLTDKEALVIATATVRRLTAENAALKKEVEEARELLAEMTQDRDRERDKRAVVEGEVFTLSVLLTEAEGALALVDQPFADASDDLLRVAAQLNESTTPSMNKTMQANARAVYAVRSVLTKLRQHGKGET